MSNDSPVPSNPNSALPEESVTDRLESTQPEKPSSEVNKNPGSSLTEDDWAGSDKTSIGAPSRSALPSDAIIDDWHGEDATSVGIPHSGGAATGSDWKGSDVTSVNQVAAPTDKLATKNEDNWIGNDRTMPIGISPLASVPATKPNISETSGTGSNGNSSVSGTGTGTGTRTRGGTALRTRITSATFDDAWHMEGRKGPYTGQIWGDWELGGILGEGGMGAVYRAKQTSLKRRVALKVLSQNLAADTKLLQRFQLEARMTSMLSSPNLVQIFAAGDWQGLHFFVMEYVDGQDLYDIIKTKKNLKQAFRVEEAANIILQAGKGLVEAGRYGMVHRDIKPSNLMVTKSGLVKVADFGIVKVMGESALTITGQAVGTPSYVSPEQGRGQLDIDQRADIYSLGVVFYELICSKKPFEAITPNALIYQHCFSEPDLPRSINPEISEEYQAVVLKCLQKKPENRYQSAEELVRDLESLQAGSLLQSAIANYRLGTGAAEAQRENLNWTQRHLLSMVMAISLVMIIGGILGMFYYQHYQNGNRRATELFHELSVLNNPQPIPHGADEDLEVYAQLPGVDQARIAVWREKLKKVGALTQSLARLDSSRVTNALRLVAPEDLKMYQELVGVDEPRGVAWRQKIKSLQEEEVLLRDEMRQLDTKSDLTEVEYQSLVPKLELLSGMTDSQDPQIIRYRKRLNDYRALQAACRERLSILDSGNMIINDERRHKLQGDFNTMELMLGKQNADIQRWNHRLISSSDQVEKIRHNLRRLEQFDLPPLSIQRDMAKDLAAIKLLVDENDPELRGWLARIASANAEIASLRERLRPIDKVDYIHNSLFSDCEAWVASLRALTGESDADAVRWSTKIRASRAYITDLHGSLERLKNPGFLTLEEQQRLSSTVKKLDELGAISSDERSVAIRRLDEESDLFQQRQNRLKGLDSASSISLSLRQDMSIYLTQLSTLDQNAKRWSEKLAAVDALMSQLASLDKAAPIPKFADNDLVRLEQLVGVHDETVLKWRAKINRSIELRKNLITLDYIQPISSNIESSLIALEGLVGEEDIDCRRWRQKVNEVNQVKSSLSDLLGLCSQSYQANHEAHAQMEHLRALIGDGDASFQMWKHRLQELDGPEKPQWATAFSRDEFGLFADLIVADTSVRFRFVPPGKFIMGSPESEKGRDADEQQVQITLSKGFWLAETECTQTLWTIVTGNNPSRDRGRLRPVERVSWLDCQQFLTDLSRMVGPSFKARLPNESEWEFACRAGGAGAFTGSSVECSTVEKLGWFSKNSRDSSHDVKQRYPNPLGLYDMQGNVAEWCSDHYSSYPTVPTVDFNGIDGDRVVARGGSWGDSSESLRAANRIPSRPQLRSAYLGLRIAVTADSGVSSGQVIGDVGSHEPIHIGPPTPISALADPMGGNNPSGKQ